MAGFYYIDQGPVNLTALAVFTSSVSTTVTTFAGAAIGTAYAGRFILMPTAWAVSTSGTDIQSLVIAGITATALASSSYSPGNRKAAIYIAALPTGTTATIVATFNANVQGFFAATFYAEGLVSAVSGSTAVSTAAAPTGTISCNEFGSMLACAFALAGVFPTANWSGITEDFDTTGFSVAHDNFTSIQTGKTLTCTFSTTTGSAGCFVAFNPN